MLSNSTTQDSVALATCLRAVSDPARLRLLRLCADRPTSVSELSLATGESEPNVSRQLKQLATAGLLQRVRRGQRVEYLPVAAAGFAAELLQLLLLRVADDETPLREARERLRSMEAVAPKLRVARSVSQLNLPAGRLGRSLRGALGTSWLQDLTNRRVLLRTGFRELFEAVQGVAAEVVIWCRDETESAAWLAHARASGITLQCLLESVPYDAKPFDVVVMAPAVAAARDEHAPARLADVCAVAERRLAPDGALWLVAAYDALDEGAGAPAQLRRLLAAHKFDCVALIPVEAEGEHVLAARCRPQGLAMRLPLSA